MITDNHLDRVCRVITDQAELLLASDAFGSWRDAESVRPGDLILCNNSFLFREGRTTNKSDKYLGIYVDAAGQPVLPPSVVSMTNRINSQFKRVQPRQASSFQIIDLYEAVATEVPRVGSIVMSLVGRIGDLEPAEVELFRAGDFRALRFSPECSAIATIEGEVLVLSRLDDLDVVWSAVATELREADIGSETLADIFEGAFHSLQEAAARPVDPNNVAEDEPSILGEILDRMEEQVSAFGNLLGSHRQQPDDNEIYNELLRIAYNLADGTRAFLGLMVGICDLKPLIFWLTAFDQVELAHRFSNLPFSLVGKGKPSLEQYRSVIANARNQAFHDLFAFSHPFRVQLSEDALRAPELRLFREYNRKADPALTFEDRELVELFQGLTRTAERPVPLGFWDKNVDVAASVTGVVRALRTALIVVASA